MYLLYILKMKFEWDPKKAAANLKKHGVSFEEGITVFDDPYALVADDEKHSTTTEKRKWKLGMSDDGAILVVIFVRIEKRKTIRIISARKSDRKEREFYETYK